MKCRYCDNENPEGSRYCSVCGGMLPQNELETDNDSKGKMIASKILSIASIPFGVLTGGLGLAMGIVGRSLDKKNRFRKLSGLGIIFGAIVLTLEVLAVITFVVLMIVYGEEIAHRLAEWVRNA